MTKLVRLAREHRKPQENGDVKIWPAGWVGEVSNKLAEEMKASGAEILSPPTQVVPAPATRRRPASPPPAAANPYGSLSGTGDQQPPVQPPLV